MLSPPQPDLAGAMYEAFEQTITSLPMPRMSSSDSDSDDSDDVDSALGLVLDRSTTSSTASMEPMERLEALQRVNADLGKKLVEAERTLQRKLSDHESELEEMEARLEEAKTELSAAKREEKELRNKDRSNQTQIAALESEIAKVQKTLDNSRTMYNSLQKQYQEQLRTYSLTYFIQYTYLTPTQTSPKTCGILFAERTRRSGIVEKVSRSSRWKRASISRKTKRTKSESYYSNKILLSLSKHRRAWMNRNRRTSC